MSPILLNESYRQRMWCEVKTLVLELEPFSMQLTTDLSVKSMMKSCDRCVVEMDFTAQCI